MSLSLKGNRNYKYKRLLDTAECNGRIAVECLQDGESSNGPDTQRRYGSIQGSNSKNDIGLTQFPQYEEIIERPNKPGESLASISLKYRISVSELKRLNKIQKDSEFFALSSLRIPVKSNSALLDMLNDELSNQNEAPLPNATRATNSMERSYQQILNDEEANKVLEKRDSFSENDEEFFDLWIPQQSKYSIMGSGADWGLKWWFVLLLGAVVIIIGPLIIYVFINYL